MEQSTPLPSRALKLVLTTCLVLTSCAFQTANHASLRPPSQQSTSSTSTSTAIHASRKGNRGTKNKKPISDNNFKRNRPQISDVLYGIDSPPEFPHSVDPSAVPPGPVGADPLAPLVRTIVHAADMRKASDVVALRVTGCTSIAEFVVIASGTSRPQNQAIANAVARDVEEEYDGRRCLGKGVPEGTADSGWILLDYGEIMVHVMTPKSRLFYDMEGQWRERGGEYMDLSDVLMDETNMPSALDGDDAQDEGLSMKEKLDVEKELDPFWS